MPMHVQVCGWQKTSSLLRPFADFQTRCCKHVSETRVFPFLGIFETVKIEMPYLQITVIAYEFITLNDSISWAFHTPLETQCLQ